MLRKEITSHFGLTLVWLLIISVLHLGWRLNLVWFWLGGLAGTFLPDLERFLYREPFLLNPQKSPFRNVLFQAILFVCGFYVITSSASFLGKGLVMAISLRLLKDEIDHPQSFFWLLKAELSLYQQKLIIAAMTLIFLGLSFILL